MERGKSAADGVEQQELGLIDDRRSQVFGANREHPARELLDDAWFVHA
jgi:hypothetical protein